MNKRQRKKKQKKVQSQVIERLKVVKENFSHLEGNKYLDKKGIQYVFDRLIEDVRRIKL